jgi:nitroimidazol reductase NimA-like FMN-containing flavoprotein (pyridoxamine 5'-phosphate oxidase superfamily)
MIKSGIISQTVKILYESSLVFGKFSDVNNLYRGLSRVSHKAKGLSRDRCQNKKRSFAYNERQRISVFSVSCEKITVALLLLRANIQITVNLLICLTIKE